ncbi:MAG TPA: hypothetical protein VJY35_10860 [Candidatus Eisenbacteria bacterium]|nr:hypothetical protein [Candidatus Eisenbacteria bacterium]
MRLHDTETLLTPSGRGLERLVGVVAALFALLFIGLAVWVIVVGFERGVFEPPLLAPGKRGIPLVIAILLVLGIPGAWVSFRLITGRRRRDGGLLSPGALRVAGVFLILASLACLIANRRDPWQWFHTASLITGGVACWVLAERRRPRDPVDEKVSVPTSKPIG